MKKRNVLGDKVHIVSYVSDTYFSEGTRLSPVSVRRTIPIFIGATRACAIYEEEKSF